MQSDIYAFGMFLYEVMTHHYPFEKFVTCIDGSELPLSKQHWSFVQVHEPKASPAIVKRAATNATTNLDFPSKIALECPVGYIDLLKNCIAVR